MNNRFFISLILLVLFAIIRCSGDNAPQEYKPEKIHVDKSSLIMRVGEREQLIVSLSPDVAHTTAFQWISSNNAVATVIDGLIEAISVGEAVVTVKYQNVSVAIPIIVEIVKPAEIGILYDKKLNSGTVISELELNGVGQYSDEGLNITGKLNVVKLNKFYALAERVVKYHVKLSDDAKAVFNSSIGDFTAYVDIPNKSISISTNPITERSVDFLRGNREYIIEIYHIYQQARLRIIDVQTKEEAEITATHDGSGGCGAGALQPGFSVGMQWDHYCFGLAEGSSILVAQITVCALKNRVKVIFYGDSITQPEGYYPSKDFSQSWTQQIINRLKGNAISSGRGGGTIAMLQEYIKNELPYIKADYVMVTIGTNGGNTEDNLTELINYIKMQGAIPILNNTPSNESGTQIENNKLIDQVRRKFGIKGCLFDVATSINADGKEVDKSLMYWEDYSTSYGWQVYHHPNEKGSKAMYERSLIDVPEIYK